ncbi:MAG: hypothetical protein PF436_11020 [Prolixibacteraceae bacterium]|jgi:hypothetical protein|nr:hypothetical protein [Prolixibacteraceae bacterium]
MKPRYFVLVVAIVIFLFIVSNLHAQNVATGTSFCEQGMKINNGGMMVLGGWAVANMAVGAYGWSAFDGQKKYFHQMNLFWNVVNATIAGIALSNNLGYDCSSVSYDSYLNSHLSTEKTLLINSALDVGYIGTGFLLKYFSTKASQRSDLLKGYGNSLILQGGFLLVFDIVLYALLRNERISFDANISASFSPALPAFQFVYRF